LRIALRDDASVVLAAFMSSICSQPEPVIRAEGLVREYGGFRAVDGLSFTVRAGECYGLLGPNGAGKSTTLRMLIGLSAPQAGRIEVLGLPVPACSRQVRALIGVVPQSDALDPDFTVAENLRVFGRYFGLRTEEVDARLDALLEVAGLAGKRDARIPELSGGMKRRLTLARALVNDPRVLFLDEPSTGLDPQARHLIWERLRRLLREGKTIVLTTHFMEEAQRLCDRLAIVDRGRLIAEAAPQALIDEHIEPDVVEVSSADAGALAGTLAAIDGVARVERVGETVLAYCRVAPPLLAWLEAHRDLRWLRRPANLEDVFLKLTGRDLRD
jgi:lipooligosaccharide transport system ATP-binding protein